MLGLRSNAGLAIELIVGAPPSGTSTVCPTDDGYIAQRWQNIRDIKEGRVRPSPRAHRDAIALSVANLLLYARSDSITFNKDGTVTFDNMSSGFAFSESSARVINVRKMNSTQLLDVDFAKRASATSPKLLAAAAGRSRWGIKAAIAAAHQSARNDGDMFSSLNKVKPLLELVLDRGKRPLDFAALAADAVSSAQLERVAMSINPDFIDSIVKLLADLDGIDDEIDPVAANQGLRAALLKSWPALEPGDFGSGRKPHVALIYVILVTMTARQWLLECERVLVKGERVSLVFGNHLPLGYRVALARMYPLAKKAKPDDMLTDIYVGQERRGMKSKTKFGRVWQHTTSAGNMNIAQLQFVTSKREGFVCSPLGDVIVERRLVAMLPADDDFRKLVNAAEALVLVFCMLVPGCCVLNDSPPGEQRRLLTANWAGPPRIIGLCTALLVALGGEEKAGKMRLRDVDAAKMGPFLRDALVCIHLLMEHGHYVDAEKAPRAPDFRDGGRHPLSKFSVLTLVTAIVESVDQDGVGGAPSRKYTATPWCNACNCPYVGPLCKHLVTTRILTLYKGLEPTWHGDHEALYWRGGAAPTYASRVLAGKSRAAEPIANAEADALALESVPALAAQYVYNIALALQRVADGDETVNVRALLNALENAAERTGSIAGATLESDARRGGTLGRLRKAARDAGTVERDRAEGDVLRGELTAAQKLARVADVFPLPVVPPRAAAAAAPAEDASVAWGVAALTALGASALRAAAATRSAAAARSATSTAAAGGDGSSGVGAGAAAGSGAAAMLFDDSDGAAAGGAGAGAGGGLAEATEGSVGAEADAEVEGDGDVDDSGAASRSPARKRRKAAGAAERGDARPGDTTSSGGGVSAGARGHELPGLAERDGPRRRGELGRAPPDVRGSVNAGADTSQPSLHAGAGGIYPSAAPPS